MNEMKILENNSDCKNYDSIAEDYVLNLLKIHGHNFVMKANSIVNPDWDLVEFVKPSAKDHVDCYYPHYYQVKGHDWKSKSHVINADFDKLVADKIVEYLFIVIFNKVAEPEVYRFKISEDLKEKKPKTKNVFDEDGHIVYSMNNEKRKDKKRTISLDCFYNEKNKKYRNNYFNKWD